MPFTNSSLSLVVCSSMHGVFTPKDTAQMVSQQQQDLLLGRAITGDDIKAILEKIIVQNSPAFQSLKSVDPTSSLVQAILAPMVSAGFVPVRTPTTPPSIPWL
ncbi:hypothetical protein MMC22_003438 [Lobaria immixta]|nr:hypothetical protein [Lobaria immixta]